jgi:hypothetical protein
MPRREGDQRGEGTVTAAAHGTEGCDSATDIVQSRPRDRHHLKEEKRR